MLQFAGKNIVMIGGSRGVGRRVVEASAGQGARGSCSRSPTRSAPAAGKGGLGR